MSVPTGQAKTTRAKGRASVIMFCVILGVLVSLMTGQTSIGGLMAGVGIGVLLGAIAWG